MTEVANSEQRGYLTSKVLETFEVGLQENNSID
jgi:hypothetical protein